jgi:hypothetical protein
MSRFAPPAIPPTQWAAAAVCGKLVAQGILERDEMLPDLCLAALRRGYCGDLIGLRTRLAWRVREEADIWRTRRNKAAASIRYTLAPLLLNLEPAPALFASAEHVNREAGEPFLPSEVGAIVREEVAAELRRRAWQGRGRGRRHVRQ